MQALRNLPKIDKFITHEAFQSLSPALVTQIAQDQIKTLREKILAKEVEAFTEEELVDSVLEAYHALLSPSVSVCDMGGAGCDVVPCDVGSC